MAVPTMLYGSNPELGINQERFNRIQTAETKILRQVEEFNGRTEHETMLLHQEPAISLLILQD